MSEKSLHKTIKDITVGIKLFMICFFLCNCSVVHYSGCISWMLSIKSCVGVVSVVLLCVCLLQWVYILDVVHKVLCWCGISSVDPALTAEVVLRLALVFESSAHIDDGKIL
jgi:hypothetical protein